MENSPTNPEPDYVLSPEQAAEAVAEQKAICEMLDTHPDLAFKDIPPELIELVTVHIMTCQDRIHHVAGLPLDEE